MANSDTPFGLKPVGHLLGASWSGKANVYYIPSSNGTALFKGDAVKSTGSSDASGKYPGVVQAAAGDEIRGVIIGFGEDPHTMIKPASPYQVHCPVSTEMYCLVVDDPFVVFEIQEDGTMDADDVGNTTQLAVTAGSTTTGLSGMELDSSDIDTDSGELKVLRIVNREDNALGANCKWEVLIVGHEMLSASDIT